MRFESLSATVAELWRDEGGATLVEYSIVIGLIAAGVALLVSGVGQEVSFGFMSLNDSWFEAIEGLGESPPLCQGSCGPGGR